MRSQSNSASSLWKNPGNGLSPGVRYDREMRARTPQGHEIPSRPPLVVSEGESVAVGDRDTTWPAFVFVVSSWGEGWVPSRNLSADSGEAFVKVDYDTTELALVAGQEVSVLERDDESGWWWCRADDDSVGWVPVNALIAID